MTSPNMNILQNNSSKRFSMDIFHFYIIIFVLGFDEPISGASSYLMWSLILLCTFCGCPSMSFKDEIKLHFDRPSIHKYDDKLYFFSAEYLVIVQTFTNNCNNRKNWFQLISFAWLNVS